MPRTINDAGLSLVKSFESFRSDPYQDDGRHIWTIGYGHTQGVTADSPAITEQEAANILRTDLQEFADIVCQYITVPLNDNQFSALVSLTENCGSAPLLDGLGQILNQGEYDEAATHFLLWDKERDDDGELVQSAGLLRRRKAEMALFLLPMISPIAQ